MSKKSKTFKESSEPFFNLTFETFQKILVFINGLIKRNKSKDIQKKEGYPVPYYSLVYRAMQELLLKNNQRFKQLEQSVVGGGWLFMTDKIADETYRYLWYNLLFAVKNENDDAVITYWKNAFQFFQYSLGKIQEVIDSEEFFKVLNEDEILIREKERERFLEFHYALGGLLLYKKRYKCIKRIFDYTNSEPPKYVLFPINMTEIFRLYFYYKAGWRSELFMISGRYPYPDMEGIRTDGKVLGWICKYLSVLFIRQYTLHEYYTYQKQVDIPALPDKLSEKVVWLNHLGIFKESVELILSDVVLIKECGLSNINFEALRQTGKLKPNEIFDITMENLEKAIAESKKSQKLSIQKVNEFKDESVKHVIGLFKNIQALFNENKIVENFKVSQINGVFELFDRLAFCDDSDISYMDVESVLGTSYTLNWQQKFSSILNRMRSKSYVLKEDNFFKGMDLLGLQKENHIIVSFGINFDFYKNYKKVQGLEKDNFYNEIPVFHYGSFHPELQQTVIILKNSDLPSVEFLEIRKEEKLRYSFEEPINKNYKIYADIIDLNKKPDLLDEFQKYNPHKEVSKSVLGIIYLLTEIRWKTDAEVIQIQMDSEFEQRGLANSLDDIQKLTKN